MNSPLWGVHPATLVKMARRYRKKYYKRKGRYSANISELTLEGVQAVPGTWTAISTLTTNPVQSTSTVSQQYTVKNFEITFVIELNNSQPENIESLQCYIMYVPQGMNVGNNYNTQHPEYIMNYKYIGSPTGDGSQQYQPIRVKTRMARRLQTGDSIILFIKGYNQTQSNITVVLNGLVRWWTKAN